MTADNKLDYREELAEIQRELHEDESDARILVRRQLIFWVVRWIIGFALIGVVFYLTPGSGWLWWVAAALAALTLAYILGVAVLTRRRHERKQARVTAADEFAKAIEEAKRRGQ